MEYRVLKQTFFDLYERLDEYFDNELMQEPRAKSDIENHKNDLMQNLALEVYANYNRETYRNYDPEAYIWKKATKVWIAFTRELKRRSSRGQHISIDQLHQDYGAGDFLKDLEDRNTVAMIEELLTPDEIMLLHFRSQGLTYDDIMSLGEYPSANAAKSKFHRIKTFILKRLNKP